MSCRELTADGRLSRAVEEAEWVTGTENGRYATSYRPGGDSIVSDFGTLSRQLAGAEFARRCRRQVEIPGMKDQLPDAGRIAAMVERADTGDPGAKDALFVSLYSELHRLAEGHLRRSGSQITLGATTLLHEAYLDLNGRSQVAFPDQRRFLKYASRAMRSLITDDVRTKRAQKRGGEITFVALSEEEAGPIGASLETLSDALDELAALDGALAELVDLKFFCGFSFHEIAVMRGVSERTVQRDWAKARVLLHGALENGSDSAEGPGQR